MKKSDCDSYLWAQTTASNGTEEIKIWYRMDRDTGETHYFLDNGAECTKLVYWEDYEYPSEAGGTYHGSRLIYQGGGWLEKLLGKSFKGTSKDIDKIKKYIIYGAVIITALVLLAPAIYKKIKNVKINQV